MSETKLKPKIGKRLGYFSKNTVKYFVLGLLIIGVAYVVLKLLFNLLGNFGITLENIAFDQLVIIILGMYILGFCIGLTIEFLYNRSKIVTLCGILTLTLLTFVILFYGSLFSVGNPPIFNQIEGLVQMFFDGLINFLPFLLMLLGAGILYVFKFRGTPKYNLSNLKVRDRVILIDDGKSKNYKALSILQISNIPKNIAVREKRVNKKAIERVVISGDRQYLHYHLTSLAKLVPEFSYEIRVSKNNVVLRLIVSNTGTDINEIFTRIERLRSVVETAFQTSFSGLRCEVLAEGRLRDAWQDIFGGFGSYKIGFIERNKVDINKIAEHTYLSILRGGSIPTFKTIKNRSQIDAFVRGVLGARFDLSYVVSARPMELYDFEKQRNIIEKEAHRGSQTRNTFESRLREDEVRTDLLRIRHAEITGIWNVSNYIVVRASDKDKLESDISAIRALISTIFGTNADVLEKGSLKKSIARVPMRTLLNEPISMTSEQLAILLHLPEEPVPSLTRLDIPEFEIPPESLFGEGVSVGKALYFDKELYPFQLTVEDLRLNTFICGLIGMGKTRLAMNMLVQIGERNPNVNWLCLDWKGEYMYLKNEIQSQKIDVFIPASNVAPVELNMFDPQGANSDEHARKVFAIIREVFKSDFSNRTELSSQMEYVCKEVLRTVIKNPRMRSLEAFIRELKNYGKNNVAKNRTVMMTVNALINRFDRFRHGVLGKILDVKKSNIRFDDLMEKKVVFNLNYILTHGGAKEDARLLMNLILKYVIDKALGRGISEDLRHIVVIEDAQLLIPAVLREVPETTLVEDIPLLLRGVGESLITVATRPEISSDIIANSGIRIVFKSPYDSQKIARFQNLSDTQERYLRIMPKREAIVTVPNFQYPFRIKTGFFDYQKTPIEDLNTDFQDGRIDSQEQKLSQNQINSETSIQPERTTPINEEGQKIPLSHLERVLSRGPLNKKTLAEKLSIPKDRLDDRLKPFLSKEILTRIAPVFNRNVKQKLYFLPKDRDYVKNEIKSKLYTDFVRVGKLGELADDDVFDYKWYGRNALVKIFDFLDSNLNLSKASEEISELFEEVVERGSVELIIIVPFLGWKSALNSWLARFDSNQINVFSYYINDWNNLNNFLDSGLMPDVQYF